MTNMYPDMKIITILTIFFYFACLAYMPSKDRCSAYMPSNETNSWAIMSSNESRTNNSWAIMSSNESRTNNSWAIMSSNNYYAIEDMVEPTVLNDDAVKSRMVSYAVNIILQECACTMSGVDVDVDVYGVSKKITIVFDVPTSYKETKTKVNAKTDTSMYTSTCNDINIGANINEIEEYEIEQEDDESTMDRVKTKKLNDMIYAFKDDDEKTTGVRVDNYNNVVNMTGVKIDVSTSHKETESNEYENEYEEESMKQNEQKYKKESNEQKYKKESKKQNDLYLD